MNEGNVKFGYRIEFFFIINIYRKNDYKENSFINLFVGFIY